GAALAQDPGHVAQLRVAAESSPERRDDVPAQAESGVPGDDRIDHPARVLELRLDAEAKPLERPAQATGSEVKSQKRGKRRVAGEARTWVAEHAAVDPDVEPMWRQFRHERLWRLEVRDAEDEDAAGAKCGVKVRERTHRVGEVFEDVPAQNDVEATGWERVRLDVSDDALVEPRILTQAFREEVQSCDSCTVRQADGEISARTCIQ